MYAELDGNEIWIKASYAENKLLSKLPGSRYHKGKDMWHVTATWTTCLTMRALFRNALELGPELIKYGHAQAEREATLLGLSNTLNDDGPWNPKLFEFQRAGAAYLSFGERAVLGDEPGLGKTAQSISAVKALHDQGKDVFPILVICPQSLKKVWEREIRLWWPDYKGPVSVIDGSAVRRRRALDSTRDIPESIDVINWESVRLHSRISGYGSIRLKACESCGGQSDPRPDEGYKRAVSEAQCEVHPKELNLKKYKTVIVDEGHRAKDPNAKQTRAVWAVLHAADYRYVLTGTPLADNVGDLWSILHGIDPDSFPVKSKFLDTFAITQLNFFGGFEVLGLKPERADLFRRILSNYMRRTPKSVALPQLPAKLPVQYRYVKMKPQQAKQYKQMRDGMLTLLDSDVPLTVGSAGAQFARLRQFACAAGTYDYDTENMTLTEPSCKIDDLVEYLQDNPKPLVVATDSKQLMYLAQKRLETAKYKVGIISGDQSIDERDVAVREFQEGKTDVILLVIAAAKEGLTLTRSDTLYFLMKSESNLNNYQMENRVHRIGSEIHKSISIVVCLAEDTIEDNREYNLAVKQDRFQEVVQDKERVRKMLS